MNGEKLKLFLSNIIPKKCPECGARVKCEEHGRWWIHAYHEEEPKIALGASFWCEKCVEEYETAGGAIVHDHIFDIFRELASDPNLDETILDILKGKGG